jgi:uncharacterized membrane protein
MKKLILLILLVLSVSVVNAYSLEKISQRWTNYNLDKIKDTNIIILPIGTNYTFVFKVYDEQKNVVGKAIIGYNHIYNNLTINYTKPLWKKPYIVKKPESNKFLIVIK